MKHVLRGLAVTALLLGAVSVFLGQAPVVPLTNTAPSDEVYVCPMDPDVRGHDPGTCPRCGMKLVAGIPEAAEYSMDLKVTPSAPKPLQPAHLDFAVKDPWKNQTVSKFQLVHERLFHMFVVSQDLKVFVHDHPVQQEDGTFRYNYSFPQPGMFRILGDFYPDGSTPQLIAKTVFVPGKAPAPVTIGKDYSTKQAENMEVELVTEPPVPIAHSKTMLFFKVKPGDGLEKLLGAWGHVLAASDDLVDMIHTHPFLADGGPQIQFNIIFPRAKTYRVWVQFQRNGVVNTAHFDVPVEELK
jgi:hypothetical protein